MFVVFGPFIKKSLVLTREGELTGEPGMA